MNIEMLKNEFQEILKLEERAKHFYEYYVEEVTDEEVKQKLNGILKDELKHIAIANALINMVRK